MHRILDISTDNIIITASGNNMRVKMDDTHTDVYLGDVESVLIHNNSTLISKNALQKMAEHKIPCIFCDNKHNPVSIAMPIVAHYHQMDRMLAQAHCKQPLKNQLWKAIVRNKIVQQNAVLMALNKCQGLYLKHLAQSVKSADNTNRESVSARYYWQTLFGKDFIRDHNADGINSLLNYGYAIVRSMVCRYIVAHGLNPALGIFHHNKLNPFCLTDDIIEPFRPLVDMLVYTNQDNFDTDMSPHNKRLLASMVDIQIAISGEKMMLPLAIDRVCASLSNVYCHPDIDFILPDNVITDFDI